MMTIAELTALVGTAGFDALDRASRGAVRSRIRAMDRARPGAEIATAYDERFGLAFDDGDRPTFLARGSERMFVRGIVDRFWRAFDAAMTWATAARGPR